MVARSLAACVSLVLALFGLVPACQFERPNDVQPVDAMTLGFSVEPVAAVWVRVGDGVDVGVRVVRESGFDAPIALSLVSAPTGVTATSATIPSGAVEGQLHITVAAGAGAPGAALDVVVLGDGGRGVQQASLTLRLKGGFGALDESFGVLGVAASSSSHFGGALHIGGRHLVAAGGQVLAFDDSGAPDRAFGLDGVLSPSTTGFDLSTPSQAFLVAGAAGRFKVVLTGDQEASPSTTKLGGKVMQFSNDGILDPAFQVWSFGLLGSFAVGLVATDDTGAIYVSGDHDTGSGTEAALIRLTPLGPRDTAFGPQGYLRWSGSLITAVQSSGGRILVATSDGATATLHAVGPAGLADTSFGSSGAVALDGLVGQPGCQLLTLHVSAAPGGGAWVGGTTCLTTTPQGVLLRLTATGALDAGFAGDGIWPGIGDELGGVYGLAGLPDGTFAVVGAPRAQFSSSSVYHLRADGTHILDVDPSGVREVPLATAGLVKLSADIDRPHLFITGSLAGRAAVARAWY